jgi:hypothetical protein
MFPSVELTPLHDAIEPHKPEMAEGRSEKRGLRALLTAIGRVILPERGLGEGREGRANRRFYLPGVVCAPHAARDVRRQ